jgi:hypothetical protein
VFTRSAGGNPRNQLFVLQVGLIPRQQVVFRYPCQIILAKEDDQNMACGLIITQ